MPPVIPYEYIPQAGLANLSRYKYHGSDNSLIGRFVLQPFWNKAVTWLPTWMAYVHRMRGFTLVARPALSEKDPHFSFFRSCFFTFPAPFSGRIFANSLVLATLFDSLVADQPHFRFRNRSFVFRSL
jgi:hypothetical protein